MEDSLDSNYYQNGVNSDALDIPLKRDGAREVVTINLAEELPEDPTDLCTLLENEESEKEYWLAIAQAYAQQDKLEDAFEVVRKGLEVSKFNQVDKVSFHAFLAWLYIKLVSNGTDRDANIVNASREIEKVKSYDNANVPNNLADGVICLYKQQTDQSLDIFDRLLKLNPSNCIALFGKAKIFMKRKNYHNALKIYQQILILNPSIKPDPRLGVGICFWKLEDYKMALTSWERALALNPDNINAKILINLAKFNETFTNSLSDDKFVSNYEACLEELKKNYNTSPDNNVILLQLASFFFSKEDYDKVEKIANKILESTPTNGPLRPAAIQLSFKSQANFWIGRVYYSRQDYTQSQKYFREAIKFDENNDLAKLGLGQSQVSRNSIEEATMTFEAILKTSPKCLEAHYSLGILYSNDAKKHSQAIKSLERYINLCNNQTKHNVNESENRIIVKEPVILNSYLTLSKVFENKDSNKSLEYLTKAIEMLDGINQDIPIEVYNNVGVFHFVKNNLESATSFFKTAVSKLNNGKDDLDGDLILDDDIKSLKNQMSITLNYNLARSQEMMDEDESIKLYEDILSRCPSYFTAKLRLLFLGCISKTKPVDESIKEEIEKVLSENTSNLEVRAFYGWFIKKYHKKFHLKPDLQSNHHKETLVTYDSHDCYALISLANVYSTIARDSKPTNHKEEERKNQYYIRAAQLYQKVLGVDSKNVYAAQGIAIVLIETKEMVSGLEILRKVRDSLSDISVYLNMAHVLLDLRQFSKAIENYEIALMSYTDRKDAKILSFLGRAWYIRGAYEQNLAFFNRAKEYSEKALESSKAPPLKFNLAYIQYQIAEFIRKFSGTTPIEDIEAAKVGLNKAIISFNALAEEKFPPYPAEDLKSRAAMCSDTLLNQLDKCLEDTKQTQVEFEDKLNEAKRIREEEKMKIQKEEEERFKKQQAIQDELAKERTMLQEQAKQWAQEKEEFFAADNDDKMFDKETGEEQEKEKGKGRKGKKEKKPRKSKKKKVTDSDDENETFEETPKRKSAEPKGSEVKRRKVSKLSNEKIEDSDEDLEDFVDDNNEDEEDANDGAKSETDDEAHDVEVNDDANDEEEEKEEIDDAEERKEESDDEKDD